MFGTNLAIAMIALETPRPFCSMILSYVMLAGSIQAMNLGTSLVSKEERGKTAESATPVILLLKVGLFFVAISLSIVAVMLLAAYLRYSSRDLSVRFEGKELPSKAVSWLTSPNFYRMTIR